MIVALTGVRECFAGPFANPDQMHDGAIKAGRRGGQAAD